MSVCAVYLLGDDLILLTEAEDHDKTLAVLSQDPVDREWQAYVGPMKAEGDWQEMEPIFLADLTDLGV
jgi:L-rhamnose mutarotase